MAHASSRTKQGVPKTARAAQRRFARDAEYRQFVGPVEPTRRTPRRISSSTTVSGPVTIQRSDGSIDVLPALDPRALQQVVRLRDVTPTLRKRVERRDDGRCRYCGTSGGPFHVDHVVPVALGGGATMRNLVWSCERCNIVKGARIWRPVPLRSHLAATGGRR